MLYLSLCFASCLLLSHGPFVTRDTFVLNNKDSTQYQVFKLYVIERHRVTEIKQWSYTGGTHSLKTVKTSENFGAQILSRAVFHFRVIHK